MNTLGESVEQLDPTELATEVIKKRAVRGAAILTARTIAMQLVSFISIALLTFFLEPVEFGTFFVVSAVISFLSYFSDIGFAASLIQKKEKLTDEELKTAFTSQQILVILILVLLFFLTPLIKNFYNLGQDAVYLLWALSFSLLLSSLKTIPTVLMERRLEFNKWVIPQIAENIIFNATAVFLAWKGFGIASFTQAVLLRGFTGLFLTYLIQPWMPGVAFSFKSFKSILKFGAPYQVNTLLAMIKDDGMTLFLGGVLGTSGVGLLGWAQKWAYAPLRFFMDQVIKVTFPAFSRLQDEKEELANAVSKTVMFVSMLVFPSLVLLVLTVPILIQIIPKYTKWEGALFALTVLSINSALAAITTPLTNTLNAIGKISLTFKLMMMWTVLTWVLVPVLAQNFGVNGAAVGLTVVGLSSVVALFMIRKFVRINFLQAAGKPFVASMLMAVVLIIIKNFFDTSLMQVIAMGVGGILSYSLTIFVIEDEAGNLLKMIFKKR